MFEPLVAVALDPILLQGGLLGYFEWLYSNLSLAASVVASNWMYLMIGILAGMILGTIPGMGGTVTMTILLPFTLALAPREAFVMLSGGVGATTFSGSITAILINTPGTSSNAATLIDGYPMTQQGESETAITISALSSALGAVLAASIFILAIPLMIQVVLLFGPSEIFWIVMFAIVIIPFVVADRALFGILTAGLGALTAFVGVSPQTAEPRFTFGIPILNEGIELIAMLIGFFAIAEIVRIASLGRNTIIDFDNGCGFDVASLDSLSVQFPVPGDLLRPSLRTQMPFKRHRTRIRSERGIHSVFSPPNRRMTRKTADSSSPLWDWVSLGAGQWQSSSGHY